MAHKFQGAKRVRHSLEEVTLAMRIVIHRIGIPFVARSVVRHIQHTIHDWVAEVHVRTCHVNLSTQNHLSTFHASTVHFLKQTQIFLHRSIPIRTVHSSLRRSTLLGSNLLTGLLIHVCLALLDEFHSKVPQLLEVVARIQNLTPLEAQPLDVLLDSLYIFIVLLLRVRIIKTEVANTTIFLRHTKIYGNRLGMTDVQIAIGFRWKTSLNPSTILAFCKVLSHNLFNEAH